MPGIARASHSAASSRRLVSVPPALLAPLLLGLLGCKNDPVRRALSDAGLALRPDSGAEQGAAASGAPRGENLPGQQGSGAAPAPLVPGSLVPGLVDAGIPPELGLDPPQGGAPGAGARVGLVGSPCSSGTDCGSAPAFCIPSSSDAEFGAGGPQGGFCSLPCTSNTECLAVDAQSGCNTELGFCLGRCTPGANAAKCGLERALACVPQAGAELGVCLPTCTSDAACGPGRSCDLGATGLCRDLPAAGAGVGAPCTRETESTDCAGGICLSYRDPLDGVTVVASFCSANCIFGRVEGCGFGEPSSAPRGAACLQLQDPAGAAGDLGYCLELCDESSDCQQGAAGWACEPFADLSSALALGRAGRCLPAELSSESAFPGLFNP